MVLYAKDVACDRDTNKKQTSQMWLVLPLNIVLLFYVLQTVVKTVFVIINFWRAYDQKFVRHEGSLIIGWNLMCDING